LAGVKWLFSNGAEIVILACNTASANALRKIQQEVLPFKYADKKVLGIIIPTAEELGKFSLSKHIGVLATVATVASGSFEREVKKYNPEIKLSVQSGGKLAELIEQNKDKKKLKAEIEMVIDRLMAKNKLIDTIVFGCTHYALIEKQIKKTLPKDISVTSQGRIVAMKLANYLDRHPKLARKLSQRSSVCFYTTSSEQATKEKMAQFFGTAISVATVSLK